jgi:hypothetical protein
MRALTGLGLTLPKNSSYASFMGAKSSMVVRKTLTLTILFRLLSAASRTARRLLMACRCLFILLVSSTHLVDKM